MEYPSFSKRFFSLLGGFLIHTVIGSITMTGNISIYMASYLRKYNSSVTLDDTSIIYSLQMLGKCLTTVVGPYILYHKNPRL